MLSSMLSSLYRLLRLTLSYWTALFSFTFLQIDYSECAQFRDDLHAKVQVFSLALIFRLWSRPHYRARDFQEDMLNNLKNVAVPGTGLPLSVFCYSKLTVYAFVFLLNPLFSLLGALNQVNKKMSLAAENGGNGDNNEKKNKRRPSLSSSLSASVESAAATHTDSLIAQLLHTLLQLFHHVQDARFFPLLCEQYEHNLLHPDDWFSLWRLNCRLVSYHSLVTGSADYVMEDKWTFLTQGKLANVPISPYIEDLESLVCKNKLIEGGMGIHFYRNAAHGGDWILQEKLLNAAWLNELLPPNAPLSTMRIITTSRFSLSTDTEQKREKERHVNVLAELEKVSDKLSRGDAEKREEKDENDRDYCEEARRFVRAESAVLRLGRMNANTDHSSILFDVDMATGVIQRGTTNAHWYQLGLDKVLTTSWLPPKDRQIEKHVDYPFPQVAGKVVPDMEKAIEIVVSSHYKMMPEVPIVGWDVAFTSKGIFLLEVNLSCNFFRGTFDLPKYIAFVDEYWQHLEKVEKLSEDQKTPFAPSSQKKYKRKSFKQN